MPTYGSLLLKQATMYICANAFRSGTREDDDACVFSGRACHHAREHTRCPSFNEWCLAYGKFDPAQTREEREELRPEYSNAYPSGMCPTADEDVPANETVEIMPCGPCVPVTCFQGADALARVRHFLLNHPQVGYEEV